MSWFTQSESLEDYVPPKGAGNGSGGFTNYPFSLKKGHSSTVAFLDADDKPVPVIDYHVVSVGSETERVGCLKAVQKTCPFCDYCDQQPEDQQWKSRVKKAHCYTVLDDRGNVDNDGNAYPPRKVVRFSSDPDKKEIKKVRDNIVSAKKGFLKDIPTLQYALVEISREDEQKSPGIGKLGQVQGVLDISDHEDLEPFTEEELFAHFITDEKRLAEIAAAINGSANTETKPKIKKV